MYRLARRSECNSMSRQTVNVIILSVPQFQMDLIFSCKHGSGISLCFLSGTDTLTGARCSIIVYISSVVIFIGRQLSVSLSHPPSFFSPFFLSLFPLSLCVYAVCFSVSEADDDSSQTPPDFTVRPNIKIHDIGE